MAPKRRKSHERILNANRFCLLCALLGLLLLTSCSPPPSAQQSDVTGKWSGDYGPDADHRDPVTLELRRENDHLFGNISAGPRLIPVRATFKPDTREIVMEFDAQGNGGRTVHYKIDGKVDGNTMSGSWIHDDQRGDFRLTRK